jgi:hypothetical protein
VLLQGTRVSVGERKTAELVCEVEQGCGAGVLLQGTRVSVGERKTRALVCKVEQGCGAGLSFMSMGISRRENAIRSRVLSDYLSTRYRTPWPFYYARGCNMSFWRSDFISVNGYNHDFSGWGHEDSELTLRMLNAGILKHNIKFHCVAYHLYHIEQSRSRAASNESLLHRQHALAVTHCPHGISDYLTSYPSYIRQ